MQLHTTIMKPLALLFATAMSMAASAQVMLVTSSAPEKATRFALDENAARLQFTAEGGTQRVGVSTNLNFTVGKTGEWCDVTTTADGITVTASRNDAAETRSTELDVVVRDGFSTKLQVSQLGTAPAILADCKEMTLNDNADKFTITITTNTDVELTLPDWVTTATEPAKGVVQYQFTATRLEEEGTSRTGEIVFADKNGEAASVRVALEQRFDGYPRFAVMSDTHFGNSVGEGPVVKVTKALRNILSKTPRVDALFICGDLTDWGTPEQYKQFKSVFDDSSIVPSDLPVYVMMGNHDNYADNALKNYLVLGQPYHRLIDIKGYPFITTSMNGGGWDDYAPEEVEALGENLAEAARRYPGKPIFVFTHVPPKNTVYGTCDGEGGWGSNVLTSTLKKYPQVVIFGGHSHFPLGDPRSIHQADFTTINDGSATYSEIEPGVVNEGIHPANYGYVTEACVVHVDASSNVEVQRWDTYGNEEMLPRWRIEAPHDGSRFVYTDKRTGGTAPKWNAGSEVKVTDVANQSCKVTFPQATDDENVHHYLVELVADGQVKATHSVFSGYYLNSRMPETLTVTITGVPDGLTMTARVKAYDSYKNISEPLESEPFVTEKYQPDPSVVMPVADLFDLSFSTDGSVRDVSARGISVRKGTITPKVTFDEMMNRNVATFDGSSSCYYAVDYAEDAAIRTAFANGFTFEVMYRPSDTGNVCPLSAQESGGAGVEQASGGLIQFYCHVGGGYKNLKSSVKAEAGNYYHVVAVYDKAAAKTRIYINGAPAGEMDAKGEFGFPSKVAAQWIAVGGDASISDKTQYTFEGEIAVARMYGSALSRDEAYLLYEDATGENYQPDPDAKKPMADLFDVDFAADGTASDISDHAVVVVAGNTPPKVEHDETLNRNVAVFEGTNQCFYRIDYAKDEVIRQALTNGFTLEVMYNPANTKNVCPLSAQEGGGAGIEQGSGGLIQFYCRVGGGYKVVKSNVKAQPGQYYHVLAVYDPAAEIVKMYIDGKPAGSLPAQGSFGFPSDEAAQWFCVGGDANGSGNSQYNFEGSIAVARMYAHPVNRDEAHLLYQSVAH